MDVLALVIAGLSLLVSVLAVLHSRRHAKRTEEQTDEANRIARESLDEARSVKVAEVWSAAIRSVNERATLNPTTENAAPILRDSRTCLMALVDALPEWEALGEWIAREHVLGAGASRADLINMSTDRDRLPELSMKWGGAFTSNLRRFRATGYDQQKMERLTHRAREQMRRLCEERNWDLPPETLDGIEPLDEAP